MIFKKLYLLWRYVIAMTGIISTVFCMYFILEILMLGFSYSPAMPQSRYSPSDYVVKIECNNGGLASKWNKHLFPLVQKNDFPSWGTFRPGIYFGMRTSSSPEYLATGTMWSNELPQHNEIRHGTNQDELSNFSWEYHNGRDFGIHKVTDSTYNMNIVSTFIIPPKKKSFSPSWIQRFDITRDRSKLPSYFYFYFSSNGIEITSALPQTSSNNVGITNFRCIVYDPTEIGMSAKYAMIGYTAHSGWFNLDIIMYAEDSPELLTRPSLSYWGNGKTSFDNSINRIKQNRIQNYPKHMKPPPSLVDDDGYLKSIFESNSNTLFIQASASSQYRLEVILYEHLPVNNEKEAISYANQRHEESSLSAEDIQYMIDDAINKFEKKFDSKFNIKMKTDDNEVNNNNNNSIASNNINDTNVEESKLTHAIFSNYEINIAKRAISAILGGIGFHYGIPEIGDAVDVTTTAPTANDISDKQTSQPSAVATASAVALLSTTPSRTSFPRGFLWDEGFHQLLVSQWDSSLSIQILTSWLNAMYIHDSDSTTTTATTSSSTPCFGGWIPREMILGEESRRRVPSEFITQRVDIANPPTLLLALESLMNTYETNYRCNDDQLSNNEKGEGIGKESVCNDFNNDDFDDSSSLLDFFAESVFHWHMWLQWFLNTQRSSFQSLSQSSEAVMEGSVENNEENEKGVVAMFRWRGRSLHDGKILPNTLASGLDDYPRAAIPSSEEHHLDLLCWMIKSTAIMTRLINILETSGKYQSVSPNHWSSIQHANYSILSSQFQEVMEREHWSNMYGAYLDVGLHSDIGRMVVEVVVRCGRSDGQTADMYVPVEILQDSTKHAIICPPTVPNLLYPLGDGQGGFIKRERFLLDPQTVHLQHIPRIGYVTIFPLLLKLLPADSPRLEALLDLIENPKVMWTPYGLRSLSASDMYYNRYNAAGDAPYWRGAIWVNINYLAISALHYYSQFNIPYQERISRMYHSLRNNMMSTILSEHSRTGYFWEQYDDRNGRGMRGHPFTGWTVLVLNMMAEKY